MNLTGNPEGGVVACFEVTPTSLREQHVAANALGAMTVEHRDDAKLSLAAAELGMEIATLEPEKTEASKQSGDTAPSDEASRPVKMTHLSREAASILYAALVQYERTTPTETWSRGGGHNANIRRVEGAMAADMQEALRKQFGFEVPKPKLGFGFGRVVQAEQAGAPSKPVHNQKTKASKPELKALTLAEALRHGMAEAKLLKHVDLVPTALLNEYVDNPLMSSAAYAKNLLGATLDMLAENYGVFKGARLDEAVREAYPDTETALHTRVDHARKIIENMLEPGTHRITKLR